MAAITPRPASLTSLIDLPAESPLCSVQSKSLFSLSWLLWVQPYEQHSALIFQPYSHMYEHVEVICPVLWVKQSFFLPQSWICCSADAGQQVALPLFVFYVWGAVCGAECKSPWSAVVKGEREKSGENGWDWGNVNKKKKDERKRKEKKEGRI